MGRATAANNAEDKVSIFLRLDLLMQDCPGKYIHLVRASVTKRSLTVVDTLHCGKDKVNGIVSSQSVLGDGPLYNARVNSSVRSVAFFFFDRCCARCHLAGCAGV